MLEFIGRFHPLLVHLPIGILLIGLLLLWVSRKEKFSGLRQAAPLIFGVGTITAFLSCLTGYSLSLDGGYNEDTVSWHMWMAIAVTMASGLLYARVAKKQFDLSYKLLSVAVLLLLMVTGHLGGSLTHGPDYLNPFNEKEDSIIPRKPIPNVQEAAVYNDVVQPLLQQHCYGCHGPKKQKGKLRLDEQSLIMKGGKGGEVIIAGKGDESELIKMMRLPLNDDDHMPPKNKPQPTKEDIALIHWWINNGADFSKKVKDLSQDKSIQPALSALQSGQSSTVKTIPAVPEAVVEKAPDSIINALKKSGVVVMPVAKDNNYLSANFVTASKISSKHLQLLQPLQKQLVWLKLSGSDLNDEGLKAIAALRNLTRLHLDRTNISDKGIAALQSLRNLQYLNLVGTHVSAKGVESLKSLSALQQLYLYQTNVSGSDWATLKQLFPNTVLDSGNYSVPKLETDTTFLKPKPIKK